MTLGVDEAIGQFSPSFPLVVAISGGADSTALLVACAARWPGAVMAAHVHHGLQPAADAFEQHCRRLCSDLSIPLAVRHVDARNRPGESPEDAARRARYLALAHAAVEDLDCAGEPQIAIAQHADDQVETLLLALTRGAGLPGLSGMAPFRTFAFDGHVVRFERPLLRVSSMDIRLWLQRRAIAWVDDPTNRDEALTRNLIRARIMPALASGFPSFLDTFGRSARHAAQAQALLDERAADDLAIVGLPPAIEGLRALNPGRQANLLRHWLTRHCHTSANTAQLDELVKQLRACTTRGHGIELKVGHGVVHRLGSVLMWSRSGVRR